MRYIDINGKEYPFISGYGKNDEYRNSLNDLTQKTFGFNFEQWYQDGYWKDQYIPYSLTDGGKIVSNVSANIMDIKVFGETKRYIQLGTVMTHPDYRKLGLSRVLLEKVIADYRDKCDLIYLFANSSVLEFYPKFGFEKIRQYQCVKIPDTARSGKPLKRLDMSDEKNRAFITDKVMHNVPVSSVSMIGNAELVLFYCTLFMKNNVYFSEDFNAVVIAEFAKDTIEVTDIFCAEKIALNDLLHSLAGDNTKTIVLGFTPWDTSTYETELLEGDDTLFAMGKDLALLQNHPFRFPKLSHT